MLHEMVQGFQYTPRSGNGLHYRLENMHRDQTTYSLVSCLVACWRSRPLARVYLYECAYLWLTEHIYTAVKRGFFLSAAWLYFYDDWRCISCAPNGMISERAFFEGPSVNYIAKCTPLVECRPLPSLTWLCSLSRRKNRLLRTERNFHNAPSPLAGQGQCRYMIALVRTKVFIFCRWRSATIETFLSPQALIVGSEWKKIQDKSWSHRSDDSGHENQAMILTSIEVLGRCITLAGYIQERASTGYTVIFDSKSNSEFRYSFAIYMLVKLSLLNNIIELVFIDLKQRTRCYGHDKRLVRSSWLANQYTCVYIGKIISYFRKHTFFNSNQCIWLHTYMAHTPIKRRIDYFREVANTSLDDQFNRVTNVGSRNVR